MTIKTVALMLALAAPQAAAQGSGCQYTGGLMALEKVRATAVGTQMLGCINRTFDSISSSGVLRGTTTAQSIPHILTSTIGALTSDGIRFASAAYFTGAVTGVAGSSWTLNDKLQVGGTFYVLNGKVGIGTNAPASKLSIEGTGAASLAARAAWLNIGSSGAETYTNGNYYGIGLGFDGSFPPAFVGFNVTSSAGNTKGDIVMATRDATTDTAPTERMRLTSGGNLGIGTASPLAKASIAGNSDTAGASSLDIEDNHSNANARTWRFNASGNGFGGLAIGQSTTKGGSSFANVVTFAADTSYVAIPVSKLGVAKIPTANFDVSGDASISGPLTALSSVTVVSSASFHSVSATPPDSIGVVNIFQNGRTAFGFPGLAIDNPGSSGQFSSIGLGYTGGGFSSGWANPVEIGAKTTNGTNFSVADLVIGIRPDVNTITPEEVARFTSGKDFTMGTSTLVVKGATGFVGIGTASPQAKFDVRNPGGTTALANARSNAGIWMTNGTGVWGLAVGQFTSEDTYFQAMHTDQNGATNLSFNPYGGNVGVGNTAPSGATMELGIPAATKLTAANSYGLAVTSSVYLTPGGGLSAGIIFDENSQAADGRLWQDYASGALKCTRTINNAMDAVAIGTCLKRSGNTIVGFGIGVEPAASFDVYSGFKVNNDGAVSWGDSADYGAMSWDTGMATIYGQANKALALGSNNTIRMFFDGTTGAVTNKSSMTVESTLRVSEGSNLNAIIGGTSVGPTGMQCENDAGAYIPCAINGESIGFYQGSAHGFSLTSDGEVTIGSGVARATFTANGTLQLPAFGITWADGSVSTSAFSSQVQAPLASSHVVVAITGTSQATLNVCIASATLTTAGGRIQIGLTGVLNQTSAASNNVHTFFGVLEDGNPLTGYSVSRGITGWADSGQNYHDVTFNLTIPAPSAGAHTYCLAIANDSGKSWAMDNTFTTPMLRVDEVR